uniref:Uncharacterized protein n=1 Tax=Brassica campestris TaxID=3711 RepID=M4EQM1_BRACM
MAGLNDDVSVDIEEIYNGGKEHHVKTCHGLVSVVVYGDQEKPALITYPDVALNYLADQILEVLNFFRLESVMCMGITAGAYILSLFAVCYPSKLLEDFMCSYSS